MQHNFENSFNKCFARNSQDFRTFYSVDLIMGIIFRFLIMYCERKSTLATRATRSAIDHQLSFDKSPGRPQTLACQDNVSPSCEISLKSEAHASEQPGRERGVTVVLEELKTASTVDHASEAGQKAVTKHRKSRRKKAKNVAATAGDPKVRSSVFAYRNVKLSFLRFFLVCNFASESSIFAV